MALIILLLLASASDYFDGFLGARKYSLTSIGSHVLDPIADKILITFVISSSCISS